jgi:REP element-mobilizing transposase RayT
LVPEIRSRVFACIQKECEALNAEVIAIGGMEDHVHLLVRLPTTASVAKLMQQVKGASSHLVTHEIQHENGFKWQGAYAAFSVSPSETPRIRDYALNQEQHHHEGTWEDDVELQPEQNV